jgi:hypothetical protein
MDMNRKIQRKINESGEKECDICGNKEILEIHHIQGKKIYKPNRQSNLANICSNCHTKIHYGQVIIEKWVDSTEGRILIWHFKGEPNLTGDESKPYLI